MGSQATRRRTVVLALSLAAACADEEPALREVFAEVTVDPASLEFGETSIYEPESLVVRLESVGTLPVEVRSIRREEGREDFAFDERPFTMQPGDVKLLTVEYRPADVAADEDVLLVETDAPKSGTLRIRLHGAGVDPCFDPDLDGYGPGCPAGEDCNQNRDDVNPGKRELCDGTDDDCGGEIDEDFFVGLPCEVDVEREGGTCRRPGLRACNATQDDVVCLEIAEEELCNGRDDDCDGQSDEGLDVGGPCELVSNGCRKRGTIACAADERSTACVPFANAPELCNGEDDDCDEEIDEGFDLGADCLVIDGACATDGALACAPDGEDTACVADPAATPRCCADPQRPTSSGSCCTPLAAGACSYRCTVDVAAGRHDCDDADAPAAVVSLVRGLAHLELDLSGRLGVELRLEVCNPAGPALHLADSSGAEGTGEDGGLWSNDAELLVDGRDLVIWASDEAPAGTPQPLRRSPGFFTDACADRAIFVGDGQIASFDPCLSVTVPHLLRIDPPADSQGTPDARWFLAVGETVSGGHTGSGVRNVELCFR